MRRIAVAFHLATRYNDFSTAALFPCGDVSFIRKFRYWQFVRTKTDGPWHLAAVKR